MKDLTCFVLATGDSDFSHLFCHLRQDGRRVVGFGPRSALSEIVKNSVDRYIYTCSTVEVIPGEEDHRWLTGRGSQVEPMEDAVALVEKALVNVEKDGQLPADGMVNASQLKARLVAIDSAFDEKRYGGFSNFRAFIDSPELRKVLSQRTTKSGLEVQLKRIPATTTPTMATTIIDTSATTISSPSSSSTSSPAVIFAPSEAEAALEAAAGAGGDARAVQLSELQRGLRLLQRTLHGEGRVNPNRPAPVGVDGLPNSSVLRERMLHLDKAVDPRSLGFFTFGAFLAASRMVQLRVPIGKPTVVLYAPLPAEEQPTPEARAAELVAREDIQDSGSLEP